ncbi:hypothetical protein ACFRIB_30890 [Streptomyces mirabilis]|uniref:hypothetical protein n=1 Tax=Streptomyces mirabilis TaxID=68239 RepID=UPI00368BEE77
MTQAKASRRPPIALIGACLGKNADLYVAVGIGASQGLFVVVPDGGGGGGGAGGENMDALEVLALEPGADALEVLGVEEELIASG